METFVILIIKVLEQVDRSFKNKSDRTDSNLNEEIRKRLKNELVLRLAGQDYETAKLLSRFIKLGMEFKYYTYLEALKDIAGVQVENVFYVLESESQDFFNRLPGVKLAREKFIREEINSINL